MIQRLLFLGCIILTKGATLQESIDKAEEIVTRLANEAKKLYDSRYCSGQCPQLSYHSCSNVIPKETCSNKYPDYSQCTTDSTKISTQASLVCPARFTTSQGDLQQVNIRDVDVRRTICTFAGMDELFQENSATYPFILRQLLGTTDGIYIGFPYHQKCDNYDNRYRPWYVAGISGAKNVIIILDQSGSMSELAGAYSRIDIAKDAIKQVLNGLNNFDWVGFVHFNSDGYTYSDMMIEATSENIQALSSYIDGLSPELQTNYQAGFQKAFDLYKATNEQEAGNLGCTSTILFMTDGDITVGWGTDNDVNKLYDYISTQASKYNINIFTYSLGSQASVDVPRTIACQNKGVWTQVNDFDNLRDILTQFYKVIATGQQIQSPKWTQPYEDGGGAGTVISVVLPIYTTVDETDQLIGVIAIDMLYSHFRAYANSDQIQQRLLALSRNCSKITLTECQLEIFRTKDMQKCNQTVDCRASQKQSCSGIPPMNVFVKQSESEFYEETIDDCCGQELSNYSSHFLMSSILLLLVFLIH